MSFKDQDSLHQEFASRNNASQQSHRFAEQGDLKLIAVGLKAFLRKNIYYDLRQAICINRVEDVDPKPRPTCGCDPEPPCCPPPPPPPTTQCCPPPPPPPTQCCPPPPPAPVQYVAQPQVVQNVAYVLPPRSGYDLAPVQYFRY